MTEHTRRRLSPRTRFEVFKRDEFTCRYCGRKTPDAVLEVDHVIPVAEGGGDEMDNLVTACWECNRGKGALLLDAVSPIGDIHDQTILMLEREMQLREYNAVKRAQRDREDEDIAELQWYWNELAGGRGAGETPSESDIRRWLRVVPCEDIKDAMEIAQQRRNSYRGGIRYLGGIIRNWSKDRRDGGQGTED